MVSGKLDAVPRYRQKVRFVPLSVARPVWVDDPHFNLSYHVRHTALPAPGSDELLRRTAARLFAQRLDRRKPLWEIWMIEGLSDKRWALLSKVHHCMVDGVSATDLMTVMFDDSPAPSTRSAWEPGSGAHRRRARPAVAASHQLSNPSEGLRVLRSMTRRPRATPRAGPRCAAGHELVGRLASSAGKLVPDGSRRSSPDMEHARTCRSTTSRRSEERSAGPSTTSS